MQQRSIAVQQASQQAALPPPGAGTRPEPPRQAARWRGWIKLAVFLAPAWLSVLYYGLFASDRYVSEATFVVRNSSRTSVVGGFSAFLKLVGISSSQDDTFAVHDFITSRDAISQSRGSIDLAAIYGKKGVDFIARYPNLLYGESLDEFHKYLRSRVSVVFNANTGISTLTVQAFTPEDAHKVAKVMLDLSEGVINKLNDRIREDTLRQAHVDVQQSEERLRKAQLALTEFRNRELQIDPGRSSFLFMEMVVRLVQEKVIAQTQAAAVAASSPNSPQLAAIERQVKALNEQIQEERKRIADPTEGLAKQIARFEELMLEREFATKLLSAAIVSLDNARAETRRQQLYLERITGPNVPDKAMQPQRIYETVSIIVLNLILLLIGWLVNTGVTEHAPKIDPKFK